MSAPARGGRLRAYLEFIAAVLYFFRGALVRTQRGDRHPSRRLGAAGRAVPGRSSSSCWASLLSARSSTGRSDPLPHKGCHFAPAGRAKLAIGMAVGWGAVVVCVLAMVIDWRHRSRSHRAALGLGVAAGGCSVLRAPGARRRSRFSRVRISALLQLWWDPSGATFGFALFYAIVQALQPGVEQCQHRRLRRLQLSAFHGLSAHARAVGQLGTQFWLEGFAGPHLRAGGQRGQQPLSVVEGDPMGPFWLTGGGFGLDGSWFAFLCCLRFPVVYRVTRDLDFRYNAPVIVPGGIPVDLDAAARRQHEAAMGPSAEPAAPALVQILPASGATRSRPSPHHDSAEPGRTSLAESAPAHRPPGSSSNLNLTFVLDSNYCWPMLMQQPWEDPMNRPLLVSPRRRSIVPSYCSALPSPCSCRGSRLHASGCCLAASCSAQVITIDTHSGAPQTGKRATVDRRFAQIQPTNVPAGQVGTGPQDAPGTDPLSAGGAGLCHASLSAWAQRA